MWSSISIGMLCPTDSKRLLLEYNVKVYWYYDIHEALLSCCMLANHCAQVINTYQDWLINGFWENRWVLNAEIMNICSCLLVLSATYINVYKLAFHVQHENMVEVAFCKPFFFFSSSSPLPAACFYISVSFVILWEWVSFWSSSHFPYVAIIRMQRKKGQFTSSKAISEELGSDSSVYSTTQGSGQDDSMQETMWV